MPGMSIPSERTLMAAYGVSRSTVREAVQALVHAGFLRTSQRRGTFVVEPKLEQDLAHFYSFSAQVERLHMPQHTDVLSLDERWVTLEVADRLHLPVDAGMIVVQRLRRVADEPIVLETSYLPATLCRGLTRDQLAAQPLYEVLRHDFDLHVTRASEWFEAVVADDYEAARLALPPGAPCLLVERIAFTSDGVAVELCRSLLRGDRCRYAVEIAEATSPMP